MRRCSACRGVNVRQRSSILTRLFITIYMFLAFYFFTGDIGYGTLIVLTPLLLPYMYICYDCNTSFFGIPKIKMNCIWVGNDLDKYSLALLPSILIITILIHNFPHTGLGRIVYLPSIFLINSLIIVVYLYLSRKHKGTLNLILWMMIILTTVFLSILTYPQDNGQGIFGILFYK